MTEFVQIHFLTSYPPANLNRDELGRPKTAVVGGTQRLRISSQSLKRAWRTSETFARAVGGGDSFDEARGVALGIRTRDLGHYVFDQLNGQLDADVAQAHAVRVASVFGKLDTAGKKDDEETTRHKTRSLKQLAHISVVEKAAVDAYIDAVLGGEKEPSVKGLLADGRGTPDIALFGRMLADTPSSNVEAACQVAHAITVHRTTVEDDYFSAVDDLNSGEEDRGSAHIGTIEFAAGLFYHYVCIDRTLLKANLNGDESLCQNTLRAFLQTCLQVAPRGKQNSFASRARASFVLVEKGEQQPRSLALAFLKDVRGADVHDMAVQQLRGTLDAMDQTYGDGASRRGWFDATKAESDFSTPGESPFEQALGFVAAPLEDER